MSKEIYISSTPHETRLAIVEKDELTEIYYERENEYTLAGSIYNGKVTRVLPGMQSSFVDIGLERDAFLYITDFMEEQGDTADFDSGEARTGRRESRDRNRPRREESAREEDNGELSGKASQPVAEEEGQGRPERNASRDRRRGGSGGRDAAQEARPAAASTGEGPADGAEESGAGVNGEEEIGEGAPGADGSRRWRGRRGRRRGRGPADAGNGTPLAAPQGDAEDEFNEEGVAESLRAGAAEVQPGSDVQDPGTDRRSRDQDSERRDSDNRTGGPERRRGERRRDDPNGRSGNSGRAHGEGRPSRFGSREGGYGEASGEAGELSRPAEPFILPGESLSKYRKGDEATPASAGSSARPQATVITSQPSTQVDLAGAWDGSATLPGESLARYARGRAQPLQRERPSAEATRPAGESTIDAEPSGNEATAGGGRRRERDLRRGRVSQQGRLSAAEAVQPGVASFHEPEETPLPLNEDGSARVAAPVDDITAAAFEEIEAEAPERAIAADSSGFESGDATESFEPNRFGSEANSADVGYEPQTDLAPAKEAPSSAVLEAVEEFHEVVAEFEPGEDASASYRIDPAAPSEFRQSAPDAGVLVDTRFDEDDPIAQEGPNHGSGHEFTAVQPDGEMISEWPLTSDAEAATKEEASTATTPITHETAVASVALDQEEVPLQLPQEFNPGDGQLEEELLDEEDGDLPRLQASFDDEDTEEEILQPSGEAASAPGLESDPESGTELGTDLGSLIRDMSIDEITSSPAALEDEDDFDLDEDELEEDEFEEDELAADGDEASAAEFETSSADAGSKRASRRTGRTGDAGGFADEFGESEPFGGAEEDPEAHADYLSAVPAESDSSAQEGDRSGRRGDRRAERNPERRDARRDGRDRGRGGRRGAPAGRSSHQGNGRMSRHQAQTSDLPAISDLLKPGQEVLVQIAKEPIAKKGARITSHIALPGRFLVFMPTVQHVGVSRKIESDSERRRLKEILLSERGEASGGFIVRTAASGASEEELRSDLRFLLNLWADIKQRSESSKSPALIYHDLNLVERILRDQVTDNFSAIWVDTETEYERVLRFLQRFQPSLIRRVKLYTKDTPLFEQFGISEEINKALRSKVWLKSGGSIVINQTEALVAIDINTGKYVGKTARLEDTIVKTNLDAIPEIVRQIRLRDLGGIIVIDFIDMDERKNRTKVLAALEEELKNDRAPSKVLQFNDFGLVAITRKRVKQSLERTLSQTCNTCAGTGMVKSPTTVCNEIFIEFRKMHKHLEGDVMLRVNPEVVKQLKAGGGKWLQEMEEVAGKTILVKSDPSLHPEQFDIQ